MNVLGIALRGIVAGCAAALLLYAGMCGLYLAESNGIEHRDVLAARVAGVLVASLAVIVHSIVATRRKVAPRKWVMWAGMCVIAAVALFVLYLYPVFFLDRVANDNRLLTETAAAINAAKGRSHIPLPQGYVSQIERRPIAGNSLRVDVHLSDRVVAKVIGIDLIKVDNVAVEMQNGRIQRAWVDYF